MKSETHPDLMQRLVRKAGRLAPLLLVMILLLLGVAGPSAATYSNTPDFCASCHAMTDEYAVWKESPHAEAATCIDCHSDPGALGELSAHIKGVRMLYMTIARITPTLVMDHEIPNDYCEKCHRMVDEKAGGVRVNHEKHLDQGGRCQDCHAGLTHKKDHETRPVNERFHSICMNCHASKQVVLKGSGTTSCTACHSVLNKVMPADHDGEWLAKHGKSVSAQNCGECHMAESAGPHGLMSNPASFAAPEVKDRCAACHKTEMPHPASYLLQHGTDARSQGEAVCATCHSPQSPAVPRPEHASETFCSTCHSGITMPHPEQWLAQHGPAAETSDNPVCLVCHSSANRVRPSASYAANDFCISCHTGLEMPHTQQFTATHGQQALKSGIACQTCHSVLNPVAPQAPHASSDYCAACHSESKHEAGWLAAHGEKATAVCYTCHSEETGGTNSCQECHQGDPSQKTLFHPDRYWFLNHRTAAMEQGEESCMRCHAEIQPSCSKCHRNR